jgi:mycothiol synthase
MTTVQPVRTTGRLTASETAGILALADAAKDADGVYPLSEDAVLRIRQAGDAAEDAGPGAASGAVARVHLLSVVDDGLAGYAYLDRSDPEGPSGELVVHPRHRRMGHGTALLAAAKTAAEGRGLRFWAHGDDPGARVFAGKAGFARARVLWQMRRSLAEPLPDAPLPAGVTLRHFRPGVDDETWLEVNARAFAHHPEQGRWTAADLAPRIAEPWFDPAGFLLAVDLEDTLLGFHWTKVHPVAGGDPAIGEIYVLGVDPGGHRRGLGTALSVAGLRYLAGLGLAEAMLYVDESNPAAVALYERLGFTVWSTDVMYAGHGDA